MTDPSERPIRRSLAWNLVGNSLYSLSQWLLLVVLARVASPVEVGRFALLLAISAPAFLSLGMNLRLVQATDADRRWSLGEYLLLRHVLNVVASLAMIGLACTQQDRGFILAAVGLAGAKSAESLSQTYYGYFQLRERHDFVAQSMIARSVAGPFAFWGGYVVFGNLMSACLGLMVGWLLVQRALDRPRVMRLVDAAGDDRPRLLPVDRTRLRALGRHAFPLGLDQGVTSLTVNTPRYFVQATLGSAALGLYSTLGYLAQVVSMITTSLGLVVVPRLARHKRDARRAAFTRLLLLSTFFSVLVSMTALVLAALAGGSVIGVVLGPEYVDQQLLLVLLLGASMVTVQRSLGRGLVGAQRFKTFLAIDLLTLAATALAALILVPSHGAIGAAWSAVVGNAVGALACLIPVSAVIRSMPRAIPPENEGPPEKEGPPKEDGTGGGFA